MVAVSPRAVRLSPAPALPVTPVFCLISGMSPLYPLQTRRFGVTPLCQEVRIHPPRPNRFSPGVIPVYGMRCSFLLGQNRERETSQSRGEGGRGEVLYYIPTHFIYFVLRICPRGMMGSVRFCST